MSLPVPTDPTWIDNATWTKVPFAELGEEFGHEEGQNERGPYARKPFLVRWSDRNQFYRDARGVSGMSGGADGNWISTLPLLYPDAPEDNIFCTSIQAKGAGAYTGSNPIAYQYAIVTLGFSPLTWDASTDDPLFLNSLSTDPAEAEALQSATQELEYGYIEYPLPTAALKFRTDNAPVTGAKSMRVPMVVMNITWERLPYLPMTAVKSMTGKVNQAVFLGCDVGTVMFEGCRTARAISADGTVNQRVQMTFRFRPIPWNQFLRPDGLTWDHIVDSESNPVYQGADFSKLLFGL